MTMKKYFYLICAILGITLYMVSCNKEENETINQNGTITTTGQIDLPNNIQHTYEDCSVLTINGVSQINEHKFKIDAYYNDRVQTFFVLDDSGNVYLMNRLPMVRGVNILFSIRTTTIALVTNHPIFAPVKADEYSKVIDIVTSSSKYEALYAEVEKVIAAKRHLFDETNEELLIALSNLMDDISSDISDLEGDTSLDDIIGEGTRAIYENPKLYPFYAEINGNTLTLRNTGLTPSYYGEVIEANGRTTSFSIPARADYGGMDLFKENMDEFMLGEPRNFTFTEQGEYRFFLSRMNESAKADFFVRLANSILTTLGLQVGNDAVQEIGNAISRAMINANSGVNDTLTDPMEWVGIAYGAVVTWMEQDYWENIGKGSIIRFGQVLSGSLNFYNKIKGVFNASLRLAHFLSAPENVNFCLCYYNGTVSTCMEAAISIVEGDDQVGYANQKLLLPLVVQVQTMEDGERVETGAYHRVKFEVVSGGGTLSSELTTIDQYNQASTYFTLGTTGNQQVKATVVDVITNKEISEPVYFNASLDTAAITIRLDWSKHSSNTDIDLHVVDPYGERIYFDHMSSASGGYLDRDDTVGPGPEHIRWSNAPSGTYKIYVHYYPNAHDHDRSVTSYKVTVTTNEKTYKPKTGSIAFDQMIPIGQFTIGEDGNTRSYIVDNLENTDHVNFKVGNKE